jgi:N-acetylglucosamine-6-phosphate deacetylase
VAATALVNARLILADSIVEGALVVEGPAILDVGPTVSPPEGARVIDLAGRYLAPGLIDIHVHGGGGYSLIGGEAEQIRAYARWVVSRGVTSFLISAVGGEHRATLRNLRACAAALDFPTGGAQPLGLHLEGPFLNPKRRGAFPEPWLHLPDVARFRAYVEAASGRIRQVTLAPELPGADELVAAVVEAGAVPAMGHSDATYEQALRAFSLGVRHVTHCYNAMRPMLHRDPGCLVAALTSDSVTCELILDGAHVHPAAAELLVRAKGPDRTVLVTDAMPLAGLDALPPGYVEAGIQVRGGAAFSKDGTIIGSVATLDELVRNAVRWLPLTLPEAVRLATVNPALAIGARGKARLAPGADADLVVLDERLEVAMTLVGGEVVYERGIPAT